MLARSHFGMFAKNVVENNLAEPRAMKNEMMWGKFFPCKSARLHSDYNKEFTVKILSSFSRKKEVE